MIRIQSFQGYDIDMLELGINDFLAKFDGIRVLSASLTETDHEYKALILYEINDE